MKELDKDYKTKVQTTRVLPKIATTEELKKKPKFELSPTQIKVLRKKGYIIITCLALMVLSSCASTYQSCAGVDGGRASVCGGR